MKLQDDPFSNWKRPNIVVRKRTLHETRDLAIRIVCQKLKPLLFYYCIVALPVLAFDYVLWFSIYSGWFKPAEKGGFEVVVDFAGSFEYLPLVWLTLALETSFMGSLVTEYLGIWLFAGNEKIRFQRVLRSWWERIGQLFYYLLLTRIIRTRAFYPETILLERHPFLKKKGRLSTSRRVKNINAGGVGTEAFFSFLLTECYVVAGLVFGWTLFYSFIKTIVDEPALSLFFTAVVIYPPFATACRLFNVVYNFCYYVNYRISCEGWDVDLAFKTELAKWGVEGSDFEETNAPNRVRRRSKTLGPLALDPVVNSDGSSFETSADSEPEQGEKEASHET
ncbi:MAG: hypothetical protein IJL92_08030 [Thermoguttaceae bacterium]|nr:hypothetical protein [Thermoguttaceae bacterium]